ncbi:MAG: cytochrome P450, partial [Pseudomonadota bacterium]
MATLAEKPSESPEFTHWSEGIPEDDAIAHIPGEGGWPLVGNTFKQLADPHAFTKRMVETYGKVYKTHAFGG